MTNNNNSSNNETGLVRPRHRLSLMIRQPIHFCRIGLGHVLFNWKVIVLGQLYSLMVACSLGFGTTLVFECNLSAPASLLCIYYLVQSFHIVGLFCKCPRKPNDKVHISSKKSDEECPSSKSLSEDSKVESETHYFCNKIPLHISPWMYLTVATLHVEGNYFNLLALRYTTMTSVSLIDGFAIPSALFFSMSLIRKKYSKFHFIGVILCLTGILTNFYADMHKIHLSNDEPESKSENQWPHLMLGDGFAFVGAILYGLSDVFNELILKEFDASANEYLGMIGIFGSMICFIQAALFEREHLKAFFTDDVTKTVSTPRTLDEDIGAYKSCPDSISWMYFIGGVASTYLTYVLMCKFLKISEATLLNLSLITADFWSVGFVILAEKITPEPLFYVSLSFTIVGLLIYQTGPIPEETQHDFRASFPLENNSCISKIVKK